MPSAAIKSRRACSLLVTWSRSTSGQRDSSARSAAGSIGSQRASSGPELASEGETTGSVAVDMGTTARTASAISSIRPTSSVRSACDRPQTTGDDASMSTAHTACARTASPSSSASISTGNVRGASATGPSEAGASALNTNASTSAASLVVASSGGTLSNTATTRRCGLSGTQTARSVSGRLPPISIRASAAASLCRTRSNSRSAASSPM